MSTERLALSLVIPAYNEAKRLPGYLESIRTHLGQQYGDDYEVIVVDDGSGDGLEHVLARWMSSWAQLRVIRHIRNQGKGAAVRTGVLASRGDLVLFADADGATPIDQQDRLAAAIAEGADVAVASRLVAGVGVQRSRGLMRGLAGRLFAALARRVLGLSVRDTQCGFKMFRGQAARQLFALVEEPGYLFDLELLARAKQLGFQVAEVAVSWREVPGGHFHMLGDLPKVVAALWRTARRVQNARRGQPYRPGPP